MRRAKRAERFHWIAPLRSVIQTPWASAMVSSVKVAREDSAPWKPRISTCRPALDRLRSRKRVMKP